MAENVYLDVDFGVGNGGLGDVFYRVIDATGATVIARTQSGVFEHSDLEGGYGVQVSLPDGLVGTVIWDGDGGGLLARERVDLTRTASVTELVDTLIKRSMEDIEVSPYGGTLNKHSIYGMIQMQQFSGPVASNELPIYQTDGSTLLGTITLLVNPAAVPIVGTRG